MFKGDVQDMVEVGTGHQGRKEDGVGAVERGGGGMMSSRLEVFMDIHAEMPKRTLAMWSEPCDEGAGL